MPTTLSLVFYRSIGLRSGHDKPITSSLRMGE